MFFPRGQREYFNYPSGVYCPGEVNKAVKEAQEAIGSPQRVAGPSEYRGSGRLHKVTTQDPCCVAVLGGALLFAVGGAIHGARSRHLACPSAIDGKEIDVRRLRRNKCQLPRSSISSF